jgi:prepilin-type N-terminal cleavage/methylation domain-containing protein
MSRKHGQSAWRGAFTILEMLVVIAMLGMFLVIVGRMSVSLIHATGKAQSAENALHRMDNVVRLLRRDVWGAESISVEPADGDEDATQTVTLTVPGGTVIWHYGSPSPAGSAGASPSPARLSRRTAIDGVTDPRQDWDHFPLDMRFAADGPSLLVTLPGGSMSSGDVLRLPSQTMLMRAGGVEREGEPR